VAVEQHQAGILGGEVRDAAAVDVTLSLGLELSAV